MKDAMMIAADEVASRSNTGLPTTDQVCMNFEKVRCEISLG